MGTSLTGGGSRRDLWASFIERFDMWGSQARETGNQELGAPVMGNETQVRAFRVGIAGPVGSGKTALADRLSKKLFPKINLAVVTNDIYTKEDAEFLLRQGTLPAERVKGVETGACPHAAIREDVSMNLQAIAELEDSLPGLELIFVASGGGNRATPLSPL